VADCVDSGVDDGDCASVFFAQKDALVCGLCLGVYGDQVIPHVAGACVGCAGVIAPSVGLLQHTFNRALAMPLRLPTATAMLMAMGVVPITRRAGRSCLAVALGAMLGVGWWWWQFSFLTAFFCKAGAGAYNYSVAE
jgi:hypothetical protein